MVAAVSQELVLSFPPGALLAGGLAQVSNTTLALREGASDAPF
jgi:hypothetical protein